jgi:hypothetical protein
MNTKGFSFPCPCLVSNEEDKPFQRFIEAAKTDPDKIYNPWPQIACSDNFYQAYSNPLVKIVYVPQIIKSVYPESIAQIVTRAHEALHLAFDISPAKLLARTFIITAYDRILELLNRESWDEQIWHELQKMNPHLSAICSDISLSEELLAIAYSIELTSLGVGIKVSLSSEDMVILERLEEESVKKYEFLSPDFDVLYYETLRKWCDGLGKTTIFHCHI